MSTRPSPAAVGVELDRLLAAAAKHPRHRISDHNVEVAAYRLGYSTGHVRRLLVGFVGRRQFRWDVGEWLLPLWYAHGNLTALHNDLLATRAELELAGFPVPAELAAVPASYVTFWRAFDRLPARYKAFPRAGANGVRRRLISLRWEAQHRNEIWQADCCKLDIWVLPEHGAKPVRPWLIVFIDDATRLVVAATVCLAQPSAEETAATCARALRLKTSPDGSTVYGGRPARILWDNGPEFRAELLTVLGVEAGFTPTPVLRHTPTHKGKIERWFGTFQRWVLLSLPGYSKSPKLADGTPVFLGEPGELLTDTQLWAHISDRIDHYNWFRSHSSLRRRTPGQAWQSDTTRLVEVPADRLRCAVLRADKPRTAHGDGIAFRTTKYLPLDAVYGDWIDTRLTVGYLPHDRSFIELFLPNGNWLCTAYEQGSFTSDEIYELVHRRAKHADQIHQAALDAKQLRLARAAAIDPDSGRAPSLVATHLARRIGIVADPTAPPPQPALAPDEEWLHASRAALDTDDP